MEGAKFSLTTVSAPKRGIGVKPVLPERIVGLRCYRWRFMQDSGRRRRRSYSLPRMFQRSCRMRGNSPEQEHAQRCQDEL